MWSGSSRPRDTCAGRFGKPRTRYEGNGKNCEASDLLLNAWFRANQQMLVICGAPPTLTNTFAMTHGSSAAEFNVRWEISDCLPGSAASLGLGIGTEEGWCERWERTADCSWEQLLAACPQVEEATLISNALLGAPA